MIFDFFNKSHDFFVPWGGGLCELLSRTQPISSPERWRLLPRSPYTGSRDIRPRPFRPRPIRPGLFVPRNFRPRSFCPRFFRPSVNSSDGFFVPVFFVPGIFVPDFPPISRKLFVVPRYNLHHHSS